MPIRGERIGILENTKNVSNKGRKKNALICIGYMISFQQTIKTSKVYVMSTACILYKVSVSQQKLTKFEPSLCYTKVSESHTHMASN